MYSTREVKRRIPKDYLTNITEDYQRRYNKKKGKEKKRDDERSKQQGDEGVEGEKTGEEAAPEEDLDGDADGKEGGDGDGGNDAGDAQRDNPIVKRRRLGEGEEEEGAPDESHDGDEEKGKEAPEEDRDGNRDGEDEEEEKEPPEETLDGEEEGGDEEKGKEPPEENLDGEEGGDAQEETLVDNAFTPPQWTYWCAGHNIAWYLSDDPRRRNGTVYPVVHENYCVTPGITVALRASFDPLKVPQLDHDRTVSYLRLAGGEFCNRTGVSWFEPEDGDEETEQQDDGTCFHMVDNVGFAAVRSRTPSSAGMKGVVPDLNQRTMIEHMPELTDMMWTIMKDGEKSRVCTLAILDAKDVRPNFGSVASSTEFAISNGNLIATNEYFSKHIYDISEENARGQCTIGHSCKASSKDLLQQYVDLKQEMGSGFDVFEGQIAVRE
ncbi:hypothetical protein ACHAWF_008436 [Thalassiosira exigua]